ncbi:MAG: penicillin acylase family protein [Promethearchaeota archaeon]
MKKKQGNILRVVTAGGLMAAVLVAFSMPLGMIPPIGNLLNPFGGVWNIDHTDPAVQDIKIADLSGDVVVIKDEFGIPHIYGEHELDVATVFGYMHAHDRLFQLEMTLRQISGTLSEVVGNATLDTDEYFRTLRLTASAETLATYLQSNDPETYQLLTSYVAGINAYIDHAKTLPFEFHFLGIKPSHWSAVNVLAMEKYMDYMLTFDTSDLIRTSLNESFSGTYPGIMDELYPITTPFQKPITVDYGSAPGEHAVVPFGDEPSLGRSVASAIEIINKAHGNPDYVLSRGNFIGSNNWAVNSSKSATGAPILCNDMHLAWSLPAIWYEAHLVAIDKGLNVQGFSLVGTPLIIVGHNEDIAWGMTNANLDHLDWYFYEGNNTHYWYEPSGQYLPYETITEPIKVKGGNTVNYQIKTTIHGPVLTDTSLGKPLAFKWVANNITTLTYSAIYGFNHAGNLTEFNAALQNFSLPSQNVLYADRFGNIAIRPTGYVPFREGVTNESKEASFVINGSSGLYEWNGSAIPFDELPHSVNPDQGYLVSANQLSAGSEYPYYIQAHASNYRARRINELLASDPSVSVEDMKAIQNDVYDKIAEWFVPLALDVFNDDLMWSGGERTTQVNQSMAELGNWNASTDRYKMLTTIAAPTIFTAIFNAFKEDTFGDELAGAITSPHPAILENLSLNVPNSPWFNDTTNAGQTEDRDDIIKQAILDGISFLSGREELANLNPASWKWGLAHHVYFAHLTGIEVFDRGPYEANGSDITANPAWTEIFGNAGGGASERMIIDFSEQNNNFHTSCIVIPGGSSGDAVSEHYDDQLTLFLNGKYHSLYYYANITGFPASEIEGRFNFNGG